MDKFGILVDMKTKKLFRSGITSNHIHRDMGISMTAKGLHVFLTHSQVETFNAKDYQGKESKRQIQKAFNELVEAGYIVEIDNTAHILQFPVSSYTLTLE